MAGKDETLDAKLEAYRERGVRQVMLGLADVDGVLRGKYVSLAKFESLMRKGGGFCDCVFGWDIDDQLYESGNDALTGWHTGFPDAQYRLVVASERALPDGTPYFIGEFVGAPGEEHPVCPRAVLRRVLSRAAAAGLSAKAGFEYELFVFQETPASVRAKGYRDLVPFTPGNFGYSVLRAAANADEFQALMQYCQDFRMSLEGLHCETGPGVWETALAAAEGLEAADRAVLFKTFSKAFFQTRGAMATFMAKWSMDYPGLHCETGPGVWETALAAAEGLEAADRAVLFKTFSKAFFQTRGAMATFMAKWSMDYPGQSGHYHFSLLDEAGGNVFGAAGEDMRTDGRASLPAQVRWALGGLCAYIPELLPMLAPTTNSYTRLVKGAWAPTASTWGVDNRTAAFRLVPGGEDMAQQRIECRVGGADGNPYLVAAATLGAALAGIEQRIEPPAAVVGNAYDVEDSLPAARHFAPTLRHATERFAGSAIAKDLFGEAFVGHYAATRLWEAGEQERHVNDWQLRRYFESV